MVLAKALGAAFRNLRRAPAFTGLVVLTLALGIGATTAMFSVVDAVLLNPLPFPNADRLAEVWTTFEGGTRQPGATSGVLQALRRESELFAAVEGYQFGTVNLTGGGEPEIVATPQVTPGLFAMLGVTPQIGRPFTDADAQTGGVVILSDRLWVSRFGADPSIVGREVEIDEQPHRVIGVMPAHFRFPEGNVRLWRPIDVSPSAKPSRLQVVTARRAGLSRELVNDRLTALTPGLRASGVIDKSDTLTTDFLLQMRFGRQSGGALFILFGAVGLVLLVACVNVMNLMLVRASTRAGELALMTALGASPADVVRSVLAESMVLAAAGSAAGLVLARGLLSAILASAPPRLTFLTSATSQLDARALAFAAVLGALTCVIFGLLPAWRAARVDAIDALKQRAQGVAGSRDDWWQGMLVAAQLSLVLVLLAGSGLLLQSFAKLVSVNPGFAVDQLAVVELQLPRHRYGAAGAGLAFMHDLERRVEAIGGVAASFSAGAPPSGSGISFDIKPEAEGGMQVDFTGITLPFATVAPDYFATMGIPIIDGRTFAPDDAADVVIVNEILARRFWGDRSPVGKRFKVDAKRPWQTVVGVAADVKQMGPSDPMGDGMEFYQPYSVAGRSSFFAFLLRTTGDRTAAMNAVKQRVWEIDPKLPIVESARMEERLDEAVAGPRFYVALASAFAGSGLLLAAIGVYGVAAYWVARRKREIAIRLALGATRDRVMKMVLGRSLRLAAIGAVAGLVMAASGVRIIESMLFQTDGRDPMVLIAVTAGLIALTLAGCLVPAFKASRVDPMTTLRAE